MLTIDQPIALTCGRRARITNWLSKFGLSSRRYKPLKRGEAILVIDVATLSITEARPGRFIITLLYFRRFNCLKKHVKTYRLFISS